MKGIAAVTLISGTLLLSVFATPAFADPSSKMEKLVRKRAALASGRSRVIVTSAADRSLPLVASAVESVGGALKRRLKLVDGYVADLPNPAIAAVAANSAVGGIALDRTVTATMERTGATVGATAVRQALGYDGTGVGI